MKQPKIPEPPQQQPAELKTSARGGKQKTNNDDDLEMDTLLDNLKKDLPQTESQVAFEIDLFTKPKEMQNQQYQEKVLNKTTSD